ncbi:hypothetical protein ACUXPL_001070 [Micrococcus sp. 140720015-1]
MSITTFPKLPQMPRTGASMRLDQTSNMNRLMSELQRTQIRVIRPTRRVSTTQAISSGLKSMKVNSR